MPRMRMGRPLEIPSFLGYFLKELPDEAGAAVDAFGMTVPPLDLPGLVSACSDQELLTLINFAPPSISSFLSRIGVQVKGTRPRQPQVMKMRMAAGLRTKQQDAVRLTMTLIEPTYRLLVVRAANLEEQVPSYRIEPAVDTPALRALAVGASLDLPDPSAPLVLAWMVETQDEAVRVLFSQEQVERMSEGVAELRAAWQDSWQPGLLAWAKHRAALDCTGHGCEYDVARTLASSASTADVVSDRQPDTSATIPSQKRQRVPRSASHGQASPSTSPPAPVVEAPVVQAPIVEAPVAEAAQVAVEEPAPLIPQSTDEQAAQVADGSLAVTFVQGTYTITCQAAERVVDALAAGRSPHEQDLTTLTTWRSAMHTVLLQFGLPEDASLGDVDSYLKTQDATASVRREVESIRTLTGPAGLDEELFALRALVDALLEAWTADSVQSADVQALLALRELAVLGASGGDEDDDELLERAHTVKQALPATLSRLAAAAARGRLRLGEPAPAEAHSLTPAAPAASSSAPESLTAEGAAQAPTETAAGAASSPARLSPSTSTTDRSSALSASAGSQPAGADSGPAPAPMMQAAAAPPATAPPATTPPAATPPAATPPTTAPPARASAATATAVTIRLATTQAQSAENATALTAPQAPSAAAPAGSAAQGGAPKLEQSAAAPAVAVLTDSVVADPSESAAAEEVELGVDVLPTLTATHDPARAAEITHAVDTLLEQGRLGLAHQLLISAGAIGHADVVEIAAMAEAMQGPHGPCSLHLSDILSAIDDADLHTDPSATLISAASLITAVLLTADARAAHLLTKITPDLEAAWGHLARLTADAAHTGALMHDESASNTHGGELSQAAAQTAKARANSDYRLGTPYSTKLLAELRSTTTDLGAALATAAANDIEQAGPVIEKLTALTGETLHTAVIRLDKERRATSTRPLSGTEREEIVAALSADRTAALRWAEAASQHHAADWSSDKLSELRSALIEHGADLTAALTSYQRGAPLPGGAGAVATRAVAKLQAMVRGDRTSSQVERGPRSVLSLELLKVDGAEYDPTSGEVTLPDMHSSEEQVKALLNVVDELDFDAALDRRLGDDDFTSAARIADELDDEQVRRVAQGKKQRIAALLEELKDERLMLVRARSGVAGAQTQDMLEARIVQAERLLTGDQPEVAEAAAALAEVRSEMSSLRGQAVIDLQDKILGMHEQGLLPDTERDRLLECLQRGEFDQVEYELSYLEAEEAVPELDDKEIGEFFPGVVDGWSGGLTAARIDALADGQTIGGVTLPGSPDARNDIAQALRSWISLPARLRAGDNHDTIRDLISPVLRAIGFDLVASSVQQIGGDDARGRGRRLLQLQARPAGQAIIPAFGSLAERRYRLLLVWEQQSVEELTRLRELDATLGDPLIICYFGTISASDRMVLAKEWNDPTRRPAIVMDDAALVYTAAAQREKFARLMRITMPFSATVPFSREKTAKVPLEMFYGRRAAMSEIARMDGPSLIFGGRGMGKSALLSVMQREARDNPHQNRAVVWIELERSAEFDEPALIWAKLAEALASERIEATNTRRVKSMGEERRVHTIIEEWLEANPASRLLLLIDEADAFFAADARREFRQTSKLFALANSTSRCKVVFAGLHGVAHHHGVGNNPFSPSGALPIGPLDRGDAFRLFAQPLLALGYSIAKDDANHVLMVCNNQPYLIQLVATRLTERLLKTRQTAKAGLPWPVPRAVIDAVLSESQVKEQIHRAFKITLDLDPRFSVIVNLLGLNAYKARDTGMLSEAELLDQCRQAWPAGFADIPYAHFRELLNELEALGILGAADPVHDGRSLRGTAVLESLGNPQRIELALAETRANALTEVDARIAHRPSIDYEGRPGPLNTAQLADLAGRLGNRTRIVVGTPLTGLDHVIKALDDPLHRPVLRNVQVTNSKGEYNSLLKNGLPEEQRLTVVSPLHQLVNSSAACREALLTAQDLRPSEPKHQRAVVLTTGPGNANWLHEIATRPDVDQLVVPLQRMSLATLKLHWRDAPGKLVYLGDHVERTMEVTGGWPLLVDELVVATRKLGAEAALDSLEQAQSEPEWAAQLLTDAGVLIEPEDTVGVAEGMLLRVVRLLVDGGTCSWQDLSEFAATQAIDEPSLTVARWFGLLAVDEHGQAELAPLIAAAWQSWVASLTAG
jgi:hypothetical protein